MPAATRHHDNDTGHDACPPRGLASRSSDVFINGRGAGRVGDTYPPHGCPVHAPHSGKIAAGSATVWINGRQAGRIGDFLLNLGWSLYWLARSAFRMLTHRKRKGL